MSKTCIILYNIRGQVDSNKICLPDVKVQPTIQNHSKYYEYQRDCKSVFRTTVNKYEGFEIDDHLKREAKENCT